MPKISLSLDFSVVVKWFWYLNENVARSTGGENKWQFCEKISVFLLCCAVNHFKKFSFYIHADQVIFLPINWKKSTDEYFEGFCELLREDLEKFKKDIVDYCCLLRCSLTSVTFYFTFTSCLFGVTGNLRNSYRVLHPEEDKTHTFILLWKWIQEICHLLSLLRTGNYIFNGRNLDR